MTLYKCIPFSKTYWPYIAKEKKIRFAKIPELWNGNDKGEFDHRWDSQSQFFKKFENDLRPSYDSLFLKTVVLSMGKSPSKECWTEYCEKGGVRYEFEFDASNTADVSCGNVVYDDNKTHNLPKFLVAREPDSKIKRLLQMESGLTWGNWYSLWIWLQCSTPNVNACAHISEELVFKKLSKFQYEDEYRFVHLMEKIGTNPLKVILDDQKASLGEIGLRLVRIHTSDVHEVRKTLPTCGVEICEIGF